ncbi:MAG: long-chain fatty acid--CoA ligase [Pseudomonadota bacterium]
MTETPKSKPETSLHANGANAYPRPWLDHYPDGIDWHQPLSPQPLFKFLEDTAAEFPNAPYLNFYGKRWTYADIQSRVDRAARKFQDMGVGPGVHVGLLLPNCPQYVVAFFAVLKIGGTIVNFSPLYSVPEIRAQVEDSQTDILVTLNVAQLFDGAYEVLNSSRLKTLIVGSLSEVLPFPKGQLYKLFKKAERADVPDEGNILNFNELVKGEPLAEAATIDPETHIAVLQYTGGTTGTPKGAMLTHANLSLATFQLAAWDADMDKGVDRTFGALPFFHVFAMTVVLCVSTYAAAEIIMLPKFELNEALKLIQKHKITLMPGVPTMYTAILGHPKIQSFDLSSVRLCTSGGAPMPLEVKRDFEKMTGASVVEGYGLTETCGVATCNPIYGENKSGTIGLPVVATDIVILEQESDQPVARGETGEICVRGPQVMQGYWQRKEETAKIFAGDLMRTGDIGFIDEAGYVSIVDRVKDLILVGGFNVFPRMIEEAIYTHDAVAEVSVIGIPDPYRGETPKAFVVKKPDYDGELTESELIAFLKTRLGKHEIPSAVEFRTELPKTMVGKLSKKELEEEERQKRAAPEAQGVAEAE